jgi:LuxR family maltose regulon positive regulatory protein
LVDRSLVDRLLACEAPIISVVAPPGYGKTTLLAQWSERSTRRSAWISLDEHDNDAGVLLSYLAAAIDRVEPLDPMFRRSLSSSAVVDFARQLRRLVVAVSAMREPFVLVIDHIEAIHDQRCCDAIAELALSLPSGSQLALASRAEPPVPIVRFRAQGMLLEIGVGDLAMEPDEARELLAAADVVLSDADVLELVQRTEGWPVGLYLAALAVKADGVRPGVAIAFSGDDRLMADYLRAEVLARLPPATAAFLIRTSVLDQLCGPLCDAVMGAEGSRQILESLESSNLLLVPLDRRREWYRCHLLLRDLLRTELTRSTPELVPGLHDRAAAWFEANGRADLAIDHAQAAGDADRAARLVAGNAQLTYAAGRGDTAVRWLEWFDARGMLEQYPQVAVVGAAAEALLGRPAGAERWADAAASGSGSFDGTLPDGSRIDTWVALLESALCRRGMARMRADAEWASGRLAPGSPWEGPALFMIAMCHVLGDGEDRGAADPILARSVEVCLRTRVMPTAAAALAERAVLAIERRDSEAAARFASKAVAIVRDGNLDGYLYSIVVEAVAARLAIHRGDVAQAKELVVRASRLRPLCSAAAPYCAQFLLQLARAYLELADPGGARAVLRQVRDILHVRPDLGSVSAQADELHHMVDTIRSGSLRGSSLTAAELRLLPLLATHLSYGDIGARLIVSRNTVKTHAVSIFRKLGVSSRSEAIEVAEEIGLLER